MAKTTKRTLEDAGEGTSSKKIKLASKPEKKRKSEAAQVPVQTPSGLNDEVDFPRGGGTSFTPAEVKTIRAEAQREANEDVFKVGFEHMRFMCVFAFAKLSMDRKSRRRSLSTRSESLSPGTLVQMEPVRKSLAAELNI